MRILIYLNLLQKQINSIRFNTDKANIDGIINIILYVEKILEISDNDVKYKIPLFKEVKNEESIKKLNESLNKAIQSNVLGDSKCNLLSVPEIDIIGASEVFNGNDNEFELIYYKMHLKNMIIYLWM